MTEGNVLQASTMALKTEFDKTSYYIVLVRAVTGAILGSIPGIVYIIATGHNVTASTFGISLIQLGASIGTISMGLASVAATIVATMKSRSIGQQAHKTRKLQEYMSPEQLPVIPPPQKTDLKDDKAVQVEFKPVNGEQAQVLANSAKEAPRVEAVLQSEQPSFQDFDKTH